MVFTAGGLPTDCNQAHSQDGEPIIENEAAIAMNEVENAMDQVRIELIDLDNLIAQLNEEQLQIFKEIKASVDDGIQHEKSEWACSTFKSTFLLLVGRQVLGKVSYKRACCLYS